MEEQELTQQQDNPLEVITSILIVPAVKQASSDKNYLNGFNNFLTTEDAPNIEKQLPGVKHALGVLLTTLAVNKVNNIELYHNLISHIHDYDYSIDFDNIKGYIMAEDAIVMEFITEFAMFNNIKLTPVVSTFLDSLVCKS